MKSQMLANSDGDAIKLQDLINPYSKSIRVT